MNLENQACIRFLFIFISMDLLNLNEIILLTKENLILFCVKKKCIYFQNNIPRAKFNIKYELHGINHDF